jgi:hypothetical protein
MGAIKSSFGQKSDMFKKKTRFDLIDGDFICRVLPVSDRFTTDPYKWCVYHSVIWGYKNTDGKTRLFESTLQKKKKEIVVRDAAVERVDALKAALAKATMEMNGPLTKQLNDLVGQRGMYSVNKKYAMNVVTLDGAVGYLQIPYTSKAALDDEIKRLNAEGSDPLSLDNGRYFIFSRGNTGGKTTFAVRVLQEEIEVPGHGKMKKDRVSKISPELFSQMENDMSDLEDLYIKITPEEVEQIVKESDLKTGKSPACDRIFDLRWKAEREARMTTVEAKPTQVVTPLAPAAEEEAEEAALTPIQVAAAVVAPVPVLAAQVLATPVLAATPVAVKLEPVQVSTKPLQDQNAEELLASLGIG